MKGRYPHPKTGLRAFEKKIENLSVKPALPIPPVSAHLEQTQGGLGC